MSHHDRACFRGNGTCRVGRAIIDDEGAISSALDVGDDARDHRCLIVGSDDNPYLRRLRGHRSSRNEEKPTQNRHDADHSRIDNGSATKRWRERKCKREERIGARELVKLRIQTHRTVNAAYRMSATKKIPVEQKAS